MNYENKYNNALEKLQEALAPKDGREISGLTRACIEEIFPELKESEDEKNLKRVIWYVENPALNVVKDTMLSEWLKSIKERVQPQNLWKPSDEQIKALEYFIRGIGESGHVSPYDANLKLVHSLLNNLKKLK